MNTPRTPRQLAELREQRARLCQARNASGLRCNMRWTVAGSTHVELRAGDANPLLCTRHARARVLKLWTDADEAREVKYLRQMQLTHDRMMRGTR